MSTDSRAQSRNWTSLTSGLWNDLLNWSDTDVPDTSTESAIFDRFGTYNVALSDINPTQVKDLTATRGDLKFLSAGVSYADLIVAGDTLVGGQLEVERTSIQTTGELTLNSGAYLTASDVFLSASSTALAGGSLVDPTLMLLSDGADADLGDLSVAATGTSANRVTLEVLQDGILSVNDLQIATQSGETIGEVNLSRSTIQQAPAGKTILGRNASPGMTGNGVLTVSNQGSASLRDVKINETGSLIVVDSSITLQGDLTIDGGVYEERGSVSRSFNLDTALVIRGNGKFVSNSGLHFASDESIRLEQSATIGGAGVQVVGDVITTIAAEATPRIEGDVDNRSNAFILEAGSTLTVGGDFRGYGTTGPGKLVVEGSLITGTDTLAKTFAGDLELGDDAGLELRVEIDNLADYTAPVVQGAATLNGTLDFELDGIAAVGDRFELLSASELVGNFDAAIVPELPANQQWTLEQTASSVALVVADSSGLAGDFNGDGRVDAADYTVWRDSDGSSGPLLAADANDDGQIDSVDRGIWHENYGSTIAAIAIPEPTSLLLLSAMLVGLTARKVALFDEAL